MDRKRRFSAGTASEGKHTNAGNRLKAWSHTGGRKQQGLSRKHKSQADKPVAIQSTKQVTTKTLISVLGIVGTIDTVVLILLVARRLVLWIKGISPVLYRLGDGLANRSIAVFAKNDNLTSLKSLLIQSKLFREQNILSITKSDDLSTAEQASVYLMYWPDWKEHTAEILHMKPNSCPLVVYAPLNGGRIPEAEMVNLDDKRHTAVTNFRGRLLNDIVTAMITTSYEQE